MIEGSNPSLSAKNFKQNILEEKRQPRYTPVFAGFFGVFRLNLLTSLLRKTHNLPPKRRSYSSYSVNLLTSR